MKQLRIVVSVLMMLGICACGKQESDQIEESSEIETSHFQGAWQEYYGPGYHVEGARIWYIGEEVIRVYTYDWYSDTSWEWFINYSLEQQKGKHIVMLHYQEESGTRDESYYIVKLTDEEMIWQGVDSDKNTRHFVTSKFWETHQEY